MNINDYYSSNGDAISFSRQQGSCFAKEIAGDFNPIHDESNKRFCVPGDLLFSVALSKLGINQQMNVVFAGMVSDGVQLHIPNNDSALLDIIDDKDKKYLSIERSGAHSNNAALIENLTRNYVQFSGQTFPHLLVPLMQAHEVMINPDRPLVIYESMSIQMERLDVEDVSLAIDSTSLDVDGKRGSAHLQFKLMSDGEVIGRGAKHLVLSGLRPYEQDKIDGLCATYETWKENYRAA